MPDRAPERFLVAIEACGGGTPDLWCSSIFLGYMDIYRREKSVRGATRSFSWIQRLAAAELLI